MKKALVLALVVAFASSGAMASRTVELNPTKDSGLWAGTAASSIANSNRGDGGRMDVDTGGNTSLIQFDLSGVVLGASEYIESATLELISARDGSVVNMNLVARALRNSWVEGAGTTGGVSGSTGYPWGDAAVGDVCYNYSSISAVAVDAGFGNYKTATAGTSWGAPGATDTSTDVEAANLIDVTFSKSFGTSGVSIVVADFTVAGVARLSAWQDGSVTNDGMNLIALSADNTWSLRAATREFAGNEPILELTIVPEPATMCLLGIGAVALIRRRK